MDEKNPSLDQGLEIHIKLFGIDGTTGDAVLSKLLRTIIVNVACVGMDLHIGDAFLHEPKIVLLGHPEFL
jgi:hypothetical protein